MKNLVKAMNQKGEAFKYLKTKFPYPSDAKIEEGTFVGPQMLLKWSLSFFFRFVLNTYRYELLTKI